jgi:hypothetical protein
MKRLLSLVLFACTVASGFSVNASMYKATNAASEVPFHNGGHLHALWLRDFAPTNAWGFAGNGEGDFNKNGAGDIDFTGNIINLGDASLTAMIDFSFKPAASGSPKKELTSDSYSENGGSIDTSTWSYWDFLADGEMNGTGTQSGLKVKFTQYPAIGNADNIHGQLGFGANGKNSNKGFSTWLTWEVTGCMDATGNNGCSPLSLDLGDSSKGDINIDLSPVPVPAAFWLFGTAMFALIGLRRKSRAG